MTTTKMTVRVLQDWHIALKQLTKEQIEEYKKSATGTLKAKHCPKLITWGVILTSDLKCR